MLSRIVEVVDFPACYASERRSLIRFVMSLGCADADQAEDIVQTAFTEAFPIWDTIHYPRAWLRKVSQNELFRRRKAAAREAPSDQAPDRPGLASAALAVEQREETHMVLQALASLPDKQRQAMAWFYDDFSCAEIARELGEPPEAVRKNLSRARRNLMHSLELQRRQRR